MDKCFKIHIGRKKEKYKCSPVSLDYWKLEETENKDTGEVFLWEEYQGKKEIKEVSHERYLGDIISSDGSNTMDILKKCNRGNGTINKIKSILESTYFGKYQFEIGKTLIDSMLLGSILVNSEVAYNISKEDINKFEKCHEKGLRMLLSLPVKSPKTMLYLLTGSIPIRYQL